MLKICIFEEYEASQIDSLQIFYNCSTSAQCFIQMPLATFIEFGHSHGYYIISLTIAIEETFMYGTQASLRIVGREKMLKILA